MSMIKVQLISLLGLLLILSSYLGISVTLSAVTAAPAVSPSLTVNKGILTQAITQTAHISRTQPRKWSQSSPTASGPRLREHALAYSKSLNQLFLFGGNATGWPYENASWRQNKAGVWQRISSTTTLPSARYGASLIPDDLNHAVVLFGGSNAQDVALNETWLFKAQQWQKLPLTTTPLSRTYHSVATNPISGNSYLFGGNNGVYYYNDLWQYQHESWHLIKPGSQTYTETAPRWRTQAALAYDPQTKRLYLFGGRNRNGTVLADFWMFDLATSDWTRLDDGGAGSSPPARMAHSLTYDEARNELVLVGGVAADGETILNDTWHYHQGWSQPTLPQPISPQAYHQAVYDVRQQQIVLFSKGEVWRYE